MTNRAEFERLLDVYGFRCERFGQDLSTHARAQVVSAFAALASAPVAGEAQPVAWANEDGDPISDALKQARLDLYGKNYTRPLYAAPQASEAVRDEREAFEAHWRKDMNTEEMDLHRCEFPNLKYEDQPYACHETNRGWMTWQAARALSAQPGAQRTGGSDAE